jgi:predicted short-subunit dehydrogenase-like oxidoreductase (DUF2520 family)
MGFKHEPEYGIVGAGSVNASLLGRLPRNAVALGAVGGVSYRVASRIANTLKAGWPVRSLDDLDGSRQIFFHSPPEHFAVLCDALESARIQWGGKSLIFCDCEAGGSARARFRALGASVASMRGCGLPGRLVVQGSAPALTLANRLARELRLKALVIEEGSEALFDAAVTLGSAAFTPLIEGAVQILRQCGLRDTESVQLAASLFSATVNDYAHSGRQSWRWHIEEPLIDSILAQIAAVEEPLRALLATLLQAGFKTFDRHGAVARAVAEAVSVALPDEFDAKGYDRFASSTADVSDGFP